MTVLCERQMVPEKALEIALLTISTLKLEVSFSFYGSDIQTYHCKLINPEHGVVFYGCGKGFGIQSKVSACYEALEHYAVHRFCQDRSKNSSNYFSLHESSIINKLQALELIDSRIYEYAETIPFALFSEVSTGESLNYPLFLIDPRYAKSPASIDNFDYRLFAWNACDSGTASGTSRVEASLHALNELIERDAYSLFLIQTFMLNMQLRLINKKTIPTYLQDTVAKIEAQYSEELILVDMTSDIGVPTICVAMTKQSMLIQPIGCGTSLNREYALERALLESLQPLHIYNEHLFANQQQILANFAQTPLLAHCAKADIGSRVAGGNLIDFNTLLAYDCTVSVEQQLSTVIRLIKAKGFVIYAAVIADLESGFKCMKYIVPGFEQFYLVQVGKYILPQKRGMALVENRDLRIK